MRSLVWKLVLAVLAFALVTAPVFRSTSAWAAAPALDEAQSLYDGAKFEAAIAKLRDAISTGEVTGSDVIAARALMARCLVKSGNRLEAKQAFKTVLRSDPGFRLDPVTVPPDEIEVFDLAAKEIQQEQIEAGQRIPASLGFYFGTGSGKNEDLAEVVHSGGGPSEFDSKPEFGGSVRFPLRPRLSLDLELARFRATAKDTGVYFGNVTEYEATAIPLIISLYYTVLPNPKYRVNLFAGAGPLLASRAAFTLDQTTIRFTVGDETVGTYFHGGVEGEYVLVDRVTLTGRASMRSANSGEMFKELTYDFYNNNVLVQNRKVEFSGFAASLGVRAYIGY